MAKIGIVGDIHGNSSALREVLKHAGPCDEWWCVGDIVGYGPDPNRCVEVTRSLDGKSVVGNHDLGSIGKITTESFNKDARVACEWTSDVLKEENREFLDMLKMKELPIDEVLLSHGGPIDPVWSYILDRNEACLNFMSFDQWICFHGHSHVPMVFTAEKEKGAGIKAGDLGFLSPANGETIELEDGFRYLVNVGSVGQPRDKSPMSCYVIFDPDVGIITYHRVRYPVEEVQEMMAFVGLPEKLIARLAEGR